MTRLENLLNELYCIPRSAPDQALAERYSPVLLFDHNEPFLPLAAGYTVFRQDGPSQSMKRTIHLRPSGKPAAQVAIEYAIWWDWDIHHLYELEHTWVYVGEDGCVVRVEGSWHGKFNELALRLEGDHAFFYSEPGKHAFASGVEPFLERARKSQRNDARFTSSHAHVLINSMFDGKIRRKVFDQTLVRSYLAQKAFDPSWTFDQRFDFQPAMLLSWAALEDWIPRRVNTYLETLEQETPPSQYRALRVAETDGSLAGLQQAATGGADSAVLPVRCRPDGSPDLDFEKIFKYLEKVPMGALIWLKEEGCISRLAQWVNEKKLYQYSILYAEEVQWLAQFKSLVPRAVMVSRAGAANAQALEEAKACGAVFVHLDHVPAVQVAAGWVSEAHAAGLGVIAGPIGSQAERSAFEHLGADAVWLSHDFQERGVE